MSEQLDLGHDHFLQFFGWMPDRELNPQYADTPDVEKFGAMVNIALVQEKKCRSGITFDGEVARQVTPEAALWKVESWEPLTISPSLFCNPAKGGCGDHGFIRNGRWVPA